MIELRSFCGSCNEIKDFMFTEAEWNSVVVFLAILKPFDKYTKKLQAETVTLSDFFGFWTSLRLKLAKRSDEFAVNLFEEMNARHDLLLLNPVILGAIYLDPRYQRTLRTKKQAAIKFLVNLFLRMEDVTSDCHNDSNTAQENIEIINDSNNSEEELNAYLSAYSSVTHGNASTERDAGEKRDDVQTIIQQFDGVEQPASISVLEYWEKNKQVNPDLYRLASAVFTIPPTQTTVERAFSSFAIVFSSHRTRLHSETLQNILLTRLNHDMYVESLVNSDDFEENAVSDNEF